MPLTADSQLLDPNNPSFASIAQKDHKGERTSAEVEAFKQSLNVMGSFYASMRCTSVLQLTVMPKQPEECEGVVQLFNVRSPGQVKGIRDADAAKKAFANPSPEEVEALVRRVLAVVGAGVARYLAQKAVTADSSSATVRRLGGDGASVAPSVDFFARVVGWQVDPTAPTMCALRFAKHADAAVLVDMLRESVARASNPPTPTHIRAYAHSPRTDSLSLPQH